MKQITLLLILLLAFAPAYAQQQTLISGQIEHGGFGGPVVKFSSINDRFGVLVGGRGGWIINHTLVLGGAGYGLVNDVPAKVPGLLGEEYLDFGYGGFEMEWIINSDKLLHFSVQTLIGAGAVNYRYQINGARFSTHLDEDEVFVLEPGLTLDLNVTPWFRFSAGGSYRYVTGVQSSASSNADLTGPSAVIMLRFGKF
ncbi:MAG: hypothetical protein ONB11_01465 [candidate division KSB1 bacterium]|nr:hypothetical protein [candidate division KSB1 bacterium]